MSQYTKNSLWPVRLTITGQGNNPQWTSNLRNSLNGIKAIGIAGYSFNGVVIPVGAEEWVNVVMSPNGADRITAIQDTGKSGIPLPIDGADTFVTLGGDNGNIIKVFDKPVTGWTAISFEVEDSTGQPLSFDNLVLTFVCYLKPNYVQNFPGGEILDLQ